MSTKLAEPELTSETPRTKIVGGQRLLTFRNKLRDVVDPLISTVADFFLVPLWRHYRRAFPVATPTPRGLSLVFLLLTEQRVKDVLHKVS